MLEIKNKTIFENDTNTPSIVLATFDDIDIMRKISIDYWGEAGTFSVKLFKKIILQNLSFVIKLNEELIGYCLCENYDQKLNISLLAVGKEFLGRGYGKKLLSYCINYCQKSGYYNFALHVSVENEVAIKLYKSLGFYVYKTIPQYYKEEGEDAHYMFKDVEFDL
jgi:ribosomal protein S18 acetylase RimI-like enzyme